ncbi:MAG: family hydrolase [Gammaproteobacteria bacterium]|jgi:D-glycero-D-manno-heptose 1,7-bisphosphate phosphatase|nr:family hydrolase [Gammaproteobacteria bacterium]
MMRPAVFLDRDGVLNRAAVRNGTPHPPASLQDLQILPGVAQALSALKASGYVLVVVTNQPDVARGTATRESVEDIHHRLRSELRLDAILTCFHDNADDCECRKPKPGLLLRAARDFDLDLASSFMIGDRWRDVEAGERAGCRTFYVDGGYDERLPASYDYRVGSLPEAAGILLALGQPR